MNIRSTKLVLNGAKQTSSLLKKWKQQREQKNFDTIDVLRRSMLTEDERAAVLANSPAHIRAVAEHMRKEDGAAKALEKARTLALAYDQEHDNELTSSKASAPLDYSYVEAASAKAAAARNKENRVNNKKFALRTKTKKAESLAGVAQAKAAVLATQAADVLADKTGVDPQDVAKKAEKRTADLRKRALKATKKQRKQALKATKSQRKALAKSKKAGAKRANELKKLGAERAADLQKVGAQRADEFKAQGIAALSTAEKVLQERAAEARKRTEAAQKEARKQLAKDAKRGRKSLARNRKQVEKDAQRRQAAAAKRANKVLAKKGLKKQKKSNKFGKALGVVALLAAIAAAMKFLTSSKSLVPAKTPKVQDFTSSNPTGAAAKSKTDAAKTSDIAEENKGSNVDLAADKAEVEQPETAGAAGNQAGQPEASGQAVSPKVSSAPGAPAGPGAPVAPNAPVAPGVPGAATPPEAPAVHHAQGKSAETKDSQSATEHADGADFPQGEGAGDETDEGGRHRL